MQYLIDRYDTEHKLSFSRGSREEIGGMLFRSVLSFADRRKVTNRLFFQNAGLGPMQGQAQHFTRKYIEQSVSHPELTPRAMHLNKSPTASIAIKTKRSACTVSLTSIYKRLDHHTSLATSVPSLTWLFGAGFQRWLGRCRHWPGGANVE